MSPLILVSLPAVVVVSILVWRWREAREAVPPLPVEGGVAIRGRGFNADALERSLVVAARGLDLEVAERGDAGWSTPGSATVRVAGPVTGDRAVLVEVDAARAEDLLAELLAVLMGEGWSVSAGRGRRVVLRRHGLRASLALSPA